MPALSSRLCCLLCRHACAAGAAEMEAGAHCMFSCPRAPSGSRLQAGVFGGALPSLVPLAQGPFCFMRLEEWVGIGGWRSCSCQPILAHGVGGCSSGCMTVTGERGWGWDCLHLNGTYAPLLVLVVPRRPGEPNSSSLAGGLQFSVCPGPQYSPILRVGELINLVEHLLSMQEVVGSMHVFFSTLCYLLSCHGCN